MTIREEAEEIFLKLIEAGYDPYIAQDMAMSTILLREFNDRSNDILWERALRNILRQINFL